MKRRKIKRPKRVLRKNRKMSHTRIKYLRTKINQRETTKRRERAAIGKLALIVGE